MWKCTSQASGGARKAGGGSFGWLNASSLFSGVRRLLDRDLGARDHLAPDADLALEMPLHLVRRGGDGDRCLLQEGLPQPRLLAGADNLAVQSFDNRRRRAGRRRDAPPVRHVVAWLARL